MIAAFAPMVTQMMIDGIVNGRSSLPKFNFVAIAFMCLATTMGIMGLGFLLFAEFSYLQTQYSSSLAALGVACTAFLFSCIAAYTGIVIMKRKAAHNARRAAASANDLAHTFGSLIDSLGEELEEPIRDNPKTAIAIASLAGFLAGDHHHRH